MDDLEKLIQLQMTVTSFNQVFDRMLFECGGNNFEAYELTEEVHQARCNARKYKEYESFRVARSRMIHRK